MFKKNLCVITCHIMPMNPSDVVNIIDTTSKILDDFKEYGRSNKLVNQILKNIGQLSQIIAQNVKDHKEYVR